MNQKLLFRSVVRSLLLAFVFVSATASALVWLVPVESAQQQAFQAAGNDPWDQFEALGRAEALWWLLRVAAPIVFACSCMALRRLNGTARWVKSVFGDFVAAARASTVEPTKYTRFRIKLTFVLSSGFLVGWFVLALFHFGAGVWQRIDDWPYYRTNSGAEVLPNISQSNRDVIRYLRATTRSNTRILVVSDQRLYFLSYYLLPRRLFHPMHPQSEFEIPMAHQRRQMAAYRLEDLDPAYIRHISPDYIVEYFEGSRYVDRKRRTEDPTWIRFVRSIYGPDYVPPYTVVLHRLRRDVQ